MDNATQIKIASQDDLIQETSMDKQSMTEIHTLERAEHIKKHYTHDELAEMVAKLLNDEMYVPVDCGHVRYGRRVLTITEAAAHSIEHAMIAPF